MPIIYYQDSKYKKQVNPIEKLLNPKIRQSETFSVDLTASGTNYRLWKPYSWDLYEGLFKFSGTTGKDYSINKLIGRGIVSNMNDSLWFQVNGYSIQKIVLSEGFYAGTELATEIKTKLDTNQAFIDASAAPFTVGYASSKITITAAGSAEIQYFYVNPTVPVDKNSTAGVVIGFMTDMSYSNSIESDTLIPMLGQKVVLDSASGDTTQSLVVHELNPSWFFDIDQAFSLDVSAVAMTMDGNITFQESN